MIFGRTCRDALSAPPSLIVEYGILHNARLALMHRYLITLQALLGKIVDRSLPRMKKIEEAEAGREGLRPTHVGLGQGLAVS